LIGDNWRETRSGIYLSQLAGMVMVNIDLPQKRDNLFVRCPNIIERKGESKMGVFYEPFTSRKGDHEKGT